MSLLLRKCVAGKLRQFADITWHNQAILSMRLGGCWEQ